MKGDHMVFRVTGGRNSHSSQGTGGGGYRTLTANERGR